MTGRAAFAAILAAGMTCAAGSTARAFCGFYVNEGGGKLTNRASQVVLMREGTRTVLSMRNDYEGPLEDFAMVVPVPQVVDADNVKTLPHEIFDRVDELSSPRLVEYWEKQPLCPHAGYGFGMSGYGVGGGGAVHVRARFAVGEYDIVVLGADESTSLATWLREHDYRLPQGASALLRPYVEAGTLFFVAKVDVDRVQFEGGRARLSPLRIQYDAADFTLPVRLGMMNSPGKQDLVVHVLARGQRYEVANRPNAFIPTNIEVHEGVRERFSSFYAALLERTLQRNPGAVVTEYAWDAAKCDPCPGPTLTPTDVTTLGADVLPSAQIVGTNGQRGVASARGFTLTRLHMRYGANDAPDDLVLRPAPPVRGGVGEPDASGALSQTVEEASHNTFQARYAILHRWRGQVACEDPQHLGWGGPPHGGRRPGAAAAGETAYTRGAVSLEWAVRVPVPSIGLAPRGRMSQGWSSRRGAH